MALWKLTTKHTRTVNGVHIEKGMTLLPPPTEEDLKEAHEQQLNDKSTSLEERINIAVWRLGGW